MHFTDKGGSHALDGVGAGLAMPLAGVQVALQLVFAEAAHRHLRAHGHTGLKGIGPEALQCHCCDDPMRLAAQRAQHGLCFLAIVGLAHGRSTNLDNGVRGQHPAIRLQIRHALGLGFGDTGGVDHGLFLGQHALIHVGGLYFDRNSDALEKFATTGRCGSQDKTSHAPKKLTQRGEAALRLACMLRCTFVLAALSLCLPACGDNDRAAAADASLPADAVEARDASTQGDGPLPLGWVDFTVSGCSSGEGSEASPCIGSSPLVLRFTALAPAEVSNQVWDFGDGSDPDSSVSPEHRYDIPGSYAITLNVEGPGGTAGATRLAAVVVIPAPLAAECTDDTHCASGDCACETQGNCPELLDGGMCVLSCDSHAACGANLCIDLDPTDIASDDWHRTTCVPACDPGSDTCGETSSCQALRGVDGALNFACVTTGLLRPIGASCRDLDDNLDNGLCASGLCLDLGERGLCSESCDTLACPTGTACATFNGGTPTPHCLVNCETSSCDSDPDLSCQQPGADFTVDESPNTSGYCAPTP